MLYLKASELKEEENKYLKMNTLYYFELFCFWIIKIYVALIMIVILVIGSIMYLVIFGLCYCYEFVREIVRCKPFRVFEN